MENSNRNLEEILTDRFTAQDNFIEKQQEILKDYNKTLLQLNETKDSIVRFTLVITSITLVFILSIFIVSYFCSPTGWNNETKVENKTTTENVNRNISEEIVN